MNKDEFEKMCRYYFRKGDESWIIATLIQYHTELQELKKND